MAVAAAVGASLVGLSASKLLPRPVSEGWVETVRNEMKLQGRVG